jgi:recombination protein RecA
MKKERLPLAFGKKDERQKPSKETVETPTNDTERFKTLFAIGRAFDKKYDTTNSLLRLGSKNIVPIPVIPSGLPTLDFGALECGGLPRGRIIEIYGAPSAGKSSFALHMIAQEQKLGGIAVYVDAEHALDPAYAQTLGVDIDNLVINQPNSGEQGLQLVQDIVESKCASIIIVDSVAALVPESELAGEMSDQSVGTHARLMSRACRKLTGKVAANKVTLIFLNQTRVNIGQLYGNPTVTTGGKALIFYASVRIEASRREAITLGSKENIIGHEVKLAVKKNKVGRPFREAVVDLIYPGTERAAGFDKVSSMIEYASRRGLFEMSGSWYAFNGERLANGLQSLKETLRDREDITKALSAKIATLEKEDGMTIPMEA